MKKLICILLLIMLMLSTACSTTKHFPNHINLTNDNAGIENTSVNNEDGNENKAINIDAFIDYENDSPADSHPIVHIKCKDNFFRFDPTYSEYDDYEKLNSFELPLPTCCNLSSVLELFSYEGELSIEGKLTVNRTGYYLTLGQNTGMFKQNIYIMWWSKDKTYQCDFYLEQYCAYEDIFGFCDNYMLIGSMETNDFGINSCFYDLKTHERVDVDMTLWIDTLGLEKNDLSDDYDYYKSETILTSSDYILIKSTYQENPESNVKTIFVKFYTDGRSMICTL